MRAFELKQPKNQLVIFDIDDTLLHTTAKINVVKDGRVVRSLTNQEFNNYKLQPGEEFDFGEFRDAAKFEEESVPIGPMLDKLKSDLAAGHDVVMLTARADFDNQKAVWRTFKRHGIDINKDVHLYRAGNLPGNDSPALKKAVHVTKWLSTGKYDHVTMYDDSEKNLFVFKGLEKKFPGVEFEAHHVNPEGETKQVEESNNGKPDTIVAMFKKFLPLAIEVLELESLPKMVFLKSIGDDDQPTFGRYVNDEKTLYVALANRHPNDILRTVAHELTHYKQDTEHQLHNGSGETGSEHENQANALAGIIMRKFNKAYPEYLKVKPVVVEGWSDKYKRSINCSNPKGFSQRAHCQGRKKKSEAVEPHEPGYQHDILTMPANTLVIDTPGELDWYKIGQHFPNLDREDPHEYGQSESDMVINFANREEMVKFAKIAKRLGFNIKSIGGGPEHPEIHSEKPGATEAINKDIVRSDFYAEKVIELPEVGKLKLVATNISTDYPPQFLIDVINTEGEKIGYFRFVVHDYEEPRRFQFFAKKKDPYVVGGKVSVWSEYRRKGIASAVYKWVKSMGNDIRPSTTQTDFGKAMWKGFQQKATVENFADGRNPQDKGDSKRYNVPTKGKISTLRKIAKQGGRRGQLAHWMANMRSGRAKKKK